MAQSLTFPEASVDLEFDFTFEEGERASRDYAGSSAEVDITRVRMNGVQIPLAAISAELYEQLTEQVIAEQSRYCSACPRRKTVARNYADEQLPAVVAPLFNTPQRAYSVQANSPQPNAARPSVARPALAVSMPIRKPQTATQKKVDIDLVMAWKLADKMHKQGLLPLKEAYKKAIYALRLLADMQTKPVEFVYTDSNGSHRPAIGWFGAAPATTADSTKAPKPGVARPDALARPYYDLEVQNWRSFRIDRLILD